ncbi:MAG TPA: riboflavin synthase [Xanthobacteraceae bacterium]|nr:riboflavin synthase [Xanthobacteraceae bacterium]
MFTGIVSDVGKIAAIKERKDLRRLRVATRYDPKTIKIGASIALDGACFTVVAKGKPRWFEVEIGAESLKATTAGKWKVGKRVNLERALAAGDELGGHLVSGHIDGVAEILARDDRDDMADFRLRAPRALARYIAPKGSVTLDGISLTVNEVAGDEFSVFIIPHTLQATNWDTAKAGDAVNLEVDLIARYIARLAEAR